jgi:hypothetical protein
VNAGFDPFFSGIVITCLVYFLAGEARRLSE